MSRWSASAYRKFRDQQHRDAAEDRQVEADALDEQRVKIEMSMRKTATGDKVKKFPDVSDRGERIAAVRAAIADAFNKAEAAASLDRRMAGTRTVDSDRFPVVGDGR